MAFANQWNGAGEVAMIERRGCVETNAELGQIGYPRPTSPFRRDFIGVGLGATPAWGFRVKLIVVACTISSRAVEWRHDGYRPRVVVIGAGIPIDCATIAKRLVPASLMVYRPPRPR
jgi:hypothetical protein